MLEDTSIFSSLFLINKWKRNTVSSPSSFVSFIYPCPLCLPHPYSVIDPFIAFPFNPCLLQIIIDTILALFDSLTIVLNLNFLSFFSAGLNEVHFRNLVFMRTKFSIEVLFATTEYQRLYATESLLFLTGMVNGYNQYRNFLYWL